ncbi:MAG: hypothetical protein KDM91_22020, partial [Verrucomicrobiae bacterium]|nr:hypothetical protein [Verrucomicrobiae bacterium]
DGDGIVDDGELTSLEDAGIVSIDLLSDNQGYYTAGGDVRVHGVAQVTYADGSTTTAADAEFVYQNAPVAEAVLTDDGQAIEVSTDDGQALTIEAAPAADSGSSAVDDGSAAAVPSLTTEEEAAAAMAHAG